MPSQVYNEHLDGGVLTCNLLFQATVGANSSTTYYIYYGNTSALPPTYVTDLSSTSSLGLTTITSGYFDLDLDSDSGVISRIRLRTGSDTNLPLSPESAVYWGWHQACSSLDGNITGKNNLCSGGSAPASGLDLATTIDGPLAKEYTFTSVKGVATYTVSYRFYSHAPFYTYHLSRVGTTSAVMNNFWYSNGNFSRLGIGSGGTPATVYNAYDDGADHARMASFATLDLASIDGLDNDGTDLGGTDYRIPTASGLDLFVLTGVNQAGIEGSLARIDASLGTVFGDVEDVPEGIYGSPIHLNTNVWALTSFDWQNPAIPIGQTVSWRIKYCDASDNCSLTDIQSFAITETPPDTPTPTATTTNTPTPTADTNLIFSDGFESGDFSVWSSVYTGDGDLTVSPDAALVGSFGMHALINDNFALYVQDDNPIAEDHYQTSFYFDPNSIPMGQGDILAIFFAYADPATVVIRFELRYFNGVYQVRPRMVTDSGTWASGPWIALADTPQRFQLDWQGASAPAANNGSLVFWIDGVLRASISGVDNDTRRIDYIRMGSVAAAMPTTRGVLFFDQFQSWRAGGAVPPTRTPTLTATSTSTSTQTPTPTQTGTPAPTATETPTPTETLMPTPTTTSEPTNTPTSTPTETQTPTPTAVPTETATPTATEFGILFADGFESGDFSVWSSVYTGDGDLTVSPDAALVGSFGMSALINDNFALYVQDDNPTAEDHYQTSFYFDPNSIPMGQGDMLAIFFAYADPATVVVRFELRYFNGVYQLRPRMVTDIGTWASTPWIPLSDAPQRFQLDWHGASAPGANDGALVFWIDGVQRASISAVDNDTRRIDYIRMGSVGAAMPTTRGVLFFDQFESTR